MSPECGGMVVNVFTPAGDCVLGKLTWNITGPHITLESGESVSGENYSYEIKNEIVVDETGFSKLVPLKKVARIILKPVEVAEKPYSTIVERPSDDTYPPASYDWISRMT